MDTLTSLYLYICAATLLVSAWYNRGDVRGFSLTLLVAVGIFIPVPENHFYYWCMLGESIIFTLAYLISARSSVFIQLFSAQLIIVHFCGMHFWGQLGNNIYPVAVKVTEYSEILICLLLSNPILYKLKEKLKCQNSSQP